MWRLIDVPCMPGKYFDEFTVGEVIDHPRRRTITERDNQSFCDMTMNQQPIHLDREYAADTQFGQLIVNGLYTMALAVGMTIPEATDQTIVANLTYDEVEHPNPVFIGDTITAQSTVTHKRETSNGQRGIVTMRVDVFAVNREDEEGNDLPVCTFERTVLSIKRDAQ